jgi:hypothetical protein
LNAARWTLRGNARPQDQECQNASCRNQDSYNGDCMDSLGGARLHRPLRSPPDDAPRLPPGLSRRGRS